jgi:Flp pilus assembly protein TadG
MRNTSNSRSSRRRRSRGDVLIETALIFIVFAGMMIGTFDFGQFLFIHQALVERARSAARWGAVNDPTNTTSIQNMVLYNQPARPEEGTATYFNLTASNVSVTNPDSGTDQYRLNIRISGYSYNILSLYIAGSYTGPPITVSVPLGKFN